MRKYSAFSLMELIITIGILLILIGIVTPQFIGYLNRSKSARAQMEMLSLRTALQAYYIDWGTYPNELSSLKGASLDSMDSNHANNFSATGIQGPIDYFEKPLPHDLFWIDENNKLYHYVAVGNRCVLWSNGPNKEGLKAEDIAVDSNGMIQYSNRDKDDIVVEI